MSTPTTPEVPKLTKLQYHVITNHEHWPFDTPEDALKFAAQELSKGLSVHIYPLEVLA